jgi:hypothetical protein
MGFIGQVKDWPHEWEDALKELYGLYLVPVVAQKMSERFAYPFTMGSIAAKARRLKITTVNAQADHILTDAARELMISTNGLRSAMERMNISPYGRGSKRYIHFEDFTRLAADLAPPPEPCISTHAAGKILYFAPNSIILRIEKGDLKAYKRKSRWLVSIADIERFRRENDMIFRRDHGKILTNGDDYRFYEAADALAITRNVLGSAMRRNGMSTYGTRSRRYVRMADFARLVAMIAPTMAHISTRAAAGLLDTSTEDIMRRVKDGTLMGHCRKGQWLIDLVSVKLQRAQERIAQ